LSKPNGSLQILELSGTEYPIGAELDIQNFGTAIQQCHSLKVIDLGELADALMVSILQYGICNHPSIQQLKFCSLHAQYLTEDVVAALRCVLESSTTPQLWALQFHECNLPPTVMQTILESVSGHPTMGSLRIEYCTISERTTVRYDKRSQNASHPPRRKNYAPWS
jgi:hypothetical protein